MAVMIGVDPHKGSHTAVAIGPAQEPLGKLRVRASDAQAGKLLAWAAAWPERTWAVEGAAGLGHLLAQQLVAAGERVLDVPPKLAARVRLLEAGDTNKNDPNDALSVAIAALRAKAKRPVIAEDYAAVLKVWAKRHRDLSRARNQVACRLHAVLCELVPGGFGKELRQASAELSVAGVTLLDYPDGGLATAPRPELEAHVIGLAARHHAGGLLVFDDTGITGHRDHQAATAAAVGAAVAAGLAVLAWTLPAAIAARLEAETGTPFSGRPASQVDICVRVDRARQRRAALLHASQISPAAVLWRRLQLQGDCEHLRWI